MNQCSCFLFERTISSCWTRVTKYYQILSVSLATKLLEQKKIQPCYISTIKFLIQWIHIVALYKNIKFIKEKESLIWSQIFGHILWTHKKRSRMHGELVYRIYMVIKLTMHDHINGSIHGILCYQRNMSFPFDSFCKVQISNLKS